MNLILAMLVALVGVLAGAVLWAIATAARRSAWAPSARRRLVASVTISLGLWLGGVALLSWSGALAVWTSSPPRVFLVPLTAFAVLLVLSRTSGFRALLTAVPPSWPIALGSFRVGVELILWALFLNGLVPEQMTFAGRNFDVLVGLSAPWVAFAVGSRRIGPGWILLWNVFGLTMLANVVGTALTSVPGPLRLPWPGAPLTEIARWPMVWIPGFLVPLAVFLHVVSIRQTVARMGAVDAARELAS